MKKRWIALSLTLSMSAMLFAGCGKEEQPKEDPKPSSSPTSAGEKDNNSSEDEGKKEENPQETGLPPMTTEEITLTYACWGLAEKGEKEARDKQIAAFMNAYPNIKVEFVEVDAAAWEDGLVSLASTGSLPDVFWVHSVTNAIANEWALDVTEFYQNDPDAKEVYPSMVDAAKINGKLYSMPTVMFPYLVFLNKTYFENYNEPLPSYDWTIDEFKEIAERITHPDEFYFGTSNPNYADYFIGQYNAGQSLRGWDGTEYHFDQTWIDAYNLRLDWIDDDVCEWEPAEDKLRFLGDEGAWPPAYGRTAMHFDWTWTIAAFEDTYTAQTGNEWLYYPQPAGPTGQQIAIVDYGVIAASTKHPREAWELQKWTSWGKEGVLNRYEGYKEAGLTAVSRMPVSTNKEAWNAVKGFTDREDFHALYDHLTNIIPHCSPVAPGYDQFTAWCNDNDIFGQLDRRELAPADIAAELTKKANELKDEWISQFGN